MTKIKYLDDPLTTYQIRRKIIENLRKMDVNPTYINDIIAIDIGDIIDDNLEEFLDNISDKLCNTVLLMDVNYSVVGHLDGNTLLLEVSGDVSNFYFSDVLDITRDNLYRPFIIYDDHKFSGLKGCVCPVCKHMDNIVEFNKECKFNNRREYGKLKSVRMACPSCRKKFVAVFDKDETTKDNEYVVVDSNIYGELSTVWDGGETVITTDCVFEPTSQTVIVNDFCNNGNREIFGEYGEDVVDDAISILDEQYITIRDWRNGKKKTKLDYYICDDSYNSDDCAGIHDNMVAYLLD